MTLSTASTTPLTAGQTAIFLDRYALRDKDDPAKKVENEPRDMWRRVAHWVASSEKSRTWEDKFYEALEDFRLVLGGRIMHAAGSTAQVTASNCYVLPSPVDSRMGILNSLGVWMETQARGGGVGINMSSLRPEGSVVRGVNGTSSGPIPWMELFTTMTKDVIQQGGSRRGAAMIMLNDSHPDIIRFIEAKKTPGVLEGANLTVALSDSFMELVTMDGMWDLSWGGKVYNTIPARELWDMICQAAWAAGEPGCFWVDRYNKNRNIWYREDQAVNCTNPCGEQPLPPYGACLLGTINISAFTNSDGVNWDDMRIVIHRATRMLDNVIDLCYYPDERFKAEQLRTRRMGIGATGLADALVVLHQRYGSAEALETTERLYRTIQEESTRESIRLAEEKGAFPLCEKEKHAEAYSIQQLGADIPARLAKSGIRNGYLTSQQPSGTGSLLAGVNSGIEPVYDYDAIRVDRMGTRKLDGRAIRLFREATRGLQPTDPVPHYFASAVTVTPKEHVDMQAAAQRWNDSAISKTVNAPKEFTFEEVKELYLYAYKSGLITIAFYRDQSRQEQVLYRADDTEKRYNKTAPVRVKLPAERAAINHRFQVGDQEGYVSVGMYPDGRPGEMFITISKEGSTIRGLFDAFATAISIALQHGVEPKYLSGKFSGSNFLPSGMTDNPEIPMVTSIIDYLFRWFESKFVQSDTEVLAANHLLDPPSPSPSPIQAHAQFLISNGNGVRNGHACPEDGSMLIHQDGCEHCPSCDYTKCG